MVVLKYFRDLFLTNILWNTWNSVAVLDTWIFSRCQHWCWTGNDMRILRLFDCFLEKGVLLFPRLYSRKCPALYFSNRSLNTTNGWYRTSLTKSNDEEVVCHIHYLFESSLSRPVRTLFFVSHVRTRVSELPMYSFILLQIMTSINESPRHGNFSETERTSLTRQQTSSFLFVILWVFLERSLSLHFPKWED